MEKKIRTGTLWKLYCDGASRNNPGLAGAGIVLLKDDKPFLSEGFFLNSKTNNQAEYLALLLGFFFLEPEIMSDDELHIYSDSELMIRQLQGNYRVKDASLKILFSAANKFLRDKNHVLFHILREHNKKADTLANKGINTKKAVPEAFYAFLNRYCGS